MPRTFKGICSLLFKNDYKFTTRKRRGRLLVSLRSLRESWAGTVSSGFTAHTLFPSSPGALSLSRHQKRRNCVHTWVCVCIRVCCVPARECASCRCVHTHDTHVCTGTQAHMCARVECNCVHTHPTHTAVHAYTHACTHRIQQCAHMCTHARCYPHVYTNTHVCCAFEWGHRCACVCTVHVFTHVQMCVCCV